MSSKVDKLEEKISKLPPRDRFIIQGVLDPNFQQTDENRVLKVAAEAEQVNSYLNANQTQGEKTEYFEDVEAAVKDSLSFLETEYKERSSIPSQIKEACKRAQKWGTRYTKQCAGSKNAEIESGTTPLTQDELDEKLPCTGIRKLMLDATKECNESNITNFLLGLGIDGVAGLVDFKNKYIANTMTQLVGGLVRGKDKNNDPTAQEVACDSMATIVIGLPGAGKSTTISQIKERGHAFHIDADAIKAVIAKTFGVSINAPGMHQLSSYIRDELVEEAKKEGVNLIIEKIGDKEGSIKKAGKTLKESGYSVDLSLVHITNSRSRTNNAERCASAVQKARDALEKGEPINKIEPPRMVSDDSIKNQGNGPLLTYLSLLSQRNDEDAIFDAQSKFYACDNEVKFLGRENTAEPIVLYGISDAGAIGCSEDDKMMAEQGFLRINAITQKVVAQKMLEDLKAKGASPEQIEMLEAFTSASFSGSEGPQVKNISKSHESFIAKCEALKESLEAGMQLSDADLSLLAVYTHLDASVDSILREIYNPENASKKGDRRTALESPTIEQSEIENFVERVYNSGSCKNAAAAKVQQILGQQGNNIEQIKQAASEAAARGVSKGANGQQGPQKI